MSRVLLFGDIDLNLIDGSAIWLASLAEVFGGMPDVSVSVLQKCRLTRDVVIQSAASLPNVRFLDPWVLGSHDVKVQAALAKAPTGRLNPEAAAALIDLLDRETSFDVVFVRSMEVAGLLSDSSSVARRLWVYVTDPKRHQAPPEVAKLRAIAGRCARIVCQTDEARSALVGLLDPGAGGDVMVLPPMIPTVAVEERPPIDPAAPRLGYSGKFSPPYMILEMLDAFEKIHSKLPGAEFHFVGDKFHNFPRVDNFVESVTRRLTTTPGVVWHGGVSRAEANEILRRVHFASSWRGSSFDDSLELSTKVLEYSALGLPVLMNPNPIQRRIFGDDYPAYVTSGMEFVERVLSLTATPTLYDRAARSAQAAAAEFTYQTHHRRLQSALPNGAPRLQVTSPTPTILWVGHDFKFLRQIREVVERTGPYRGLADEYAGHVIRHPERSTELLRQADLIFCEWCLGNAEWYSQHKRRNQRLVVRFHRQEIDLPYLHRIRWENVDRVIFITYWVMNKFLSMFPDMRERAMLICNAVDCKALDVEKLFGAEFNLGLLGFCPKLKAPHLAFEILSRLKKLDSRYTLFIKGKPPWQLDWLWKRPEERRYYEDLFARIDKAPYANSVAFDPYGDDVTPWLSKIGFILSTSDCEGSHQAIAEGMASGAIPVIRNWLGADLIYPEKYIFCDSRQAASSVCAWRVRETYRAEAALCSEWARRFDLPKIVPQYFSVFRALISRSTSRDIIESYRVSDVRVRLTRHACAMPAGGTPDPACVSVP